MADAPIVHLHRPEMMSATFERGVFRSLKTGARIEYFLENLDEDNGFGGNYRGPYLLWRSVELLMRPPYNFVPFSTLNRTGAAATATSPDVFTNNEAVFSNLVLVDMQPKMVGNTINIVDVEMNYQHVMDGFNQILVNPPSGKLFVKARTSIVDKTTNFFQKEGNPAFPKTQLAVAHTYPETDKDIAATPFNSTFPRTVFQTGEVNVPFPAKGFTLQGMMFTNNIVNEAKKYVAHVNEETLFGDGPTYWICSEFSWELHNPQRVTWQRNMPAYKVSMEFQYNYDTWDVDVVFNDKRTGQPPPDLVRADINDFNGVMRMTSNPFLPVIQPAGIWRVPFLPRCNFTNEFGGVQWELV